MGLNDLVSILRSGSGWLAVLWASLPTAAPALTDPQQEPLTAAVEESVKVLRAWWEGKSEAGAVGEILAPDVSTSAVWPTRLETVTLAGGLTAGRWKPDEEAAIAAGRAEALKRLALPNGPATRTEAKFIKVQANRADGTVQTELLLGIYRFGAGHRHEVRATWKSEWTKTGERYLLKRNSLVAYSELSLAAKEPLLRDRTTAVLPRECAGDAELTQGNFHWRHRIEATLQPDPFGQNGISIADLNGDGRQDVFLAQMGGLRNRVFIQHADGTCADWSAESGLDFLDNTTSALFADFDNDGDQDAAVATAAGLLICENSGAGQFMIRKRFESLPYVFGLSAADFDLDGDLDLYACQYYGDQNAEGDDQPRGSIPVPFPIYDAHNGGRNVLLRNDGKLAFEDATAEAGLDVNNRRFSFASLWDDWDRDGDPDLVVVNDFGRITSYENRGGTFAENSGAIGFGTSGFGMGIAAGDFNRDGWTDLYVANMFSGAGSRITREPEFRGGKDERRVEEFRSMAAGNALYLSEGGRTFREAGEQAGVEMGRWGWGCAAPDLNNDGWEDLLAANGFLTGAAMDDL